MSEHEIYNPSGDEDGLPLNIPPDEAWSDMRKRLDDEMPAQGVLLPDAVIYVDNGFIRGMTSLFILLVIASCAWLFNGSSAIGKDRNSDSKSTMQKQMPMLAPLAANNNKTGTEIENSTPLQPNKKVTVAGPGSGVEGNGKSAGRFKKKGGSIQVHISAPASVEEQKMAAPDDTGKLVATSGNERLLPAIKKDTGKVAIAKSDSAAEITASVKIPDSTQIKVQAGLQWLAQLPPGSAQNYFAGPGGAPQPYLLLLPGAWVSVQANKYLFIAEFNPFATTVFNPKPFTTTVTLVGSQTTKTNSKELNKLFGLSAAIRGNYNVTGNWWAGFGLQPTLWQNGVVTSRYSLDSGGIVSGYKTAGRLTDSDWVYFSKFQLRTDAELLYKAANWHAGLRAGFFFTPVAKNYGGPGSPLQLELFFRWAPLNPGKHKQPPAH